MHAFLGLGSNVGDRIANLQAAVNFLDLRLGKIVKISPVYETEPLYIEAQDAFFNAAVELATDLEPLELLRRVKQLEIEIGRIPRERYGPREIDIDLLATFTDDGPPIEVTTAELTLPHPKITERRFVLEPLRAITDRFDSLELPTGQHVTKLDTVFLSVHKD